MLDGRRRRQGSGLGLLVRESGFEGGLLGSLEFLGFAQDACLLGDVRSGCGDDYRNLECDRQPRVHPGLGPLDQCKDPTARETGAADQERKRGGQTQTLKRCAEKPKRPECGPKPYVHRDRLDVELTVLRAGETHPVRQDRTGKEAEQGPADRTDAEEEKDVAGHADKIPPFAFQRKLVQSPSVPKVRADVLLTQRGLAPSRARAQALILAGKVFTGERRVEKRGETLDEAASLEVREPDHPYVSRGGVKLAGALDAFGYDPASKTLADFGASTGGFTDCLLQRGAAKVFAIDVGYGQLHNRLRQDPRVVVMERTNARHLQEGSLPEPLDLVVIDASFIGLEKLLPAARALLRDDGEVVALVKPQFQVGQGQVGKGGVVRDPKLRREATATVAQDAEKLGFALLGEVDCVITGPKGNQETFIWLRRSTLARVP